MAASKYSKTTIREVALINANSIKGNSAPSNIEYIDISSVGTGEFIENPKVMAFADAPSRARRIVKAGDTILSTVRPNRRSFLFLSAPNPNAVVSTGFAVLTPTTDVDARYLYHWITRQDFTDYLSLHAKGAAYPAVSAEDIGNGEINLPPLTIQRRIAGILSAYDELIENSQRRIKILEAMARSLYREWFVHFRFPGHESVPRVHSPLGDIPQGWEVKTVKDTLSRRTSGTVYRDADVKSEGTIPVIDQSAKELLGFHDNKPDHAASPEKPMAIFGDHTCKMQLLIEPFSVGPNVVPFIASQELPTAYALYAVNSLVETQEYKRHWIPLNAKNIVVADTASANRFSSLIQPMLVAQETLRKEIRNLRRTRDLLLPRLLSGLIDVEAIVS